MLRLYLLRHAKSSWDEDGIEDFDRPLSERGRQAADEMAAFIAGAGYEPGLIACSTALRTRQTLAALLPHLAGELDVKLTRRIYEAEAETLLENIRASGGAANSLMLIGHNPGFEELTSILAPDREPKAMARLGEKFPTGALAVIEFEAARWDDVGPGGGRLIAFHTPKSIAGR